MFSTTTTCFIDVFPSYFAVLSSIQEALCDHLHEYLLSVYKNKIKILWDNYMAIKYSKRKLQVCQSEMLVGLVNYVTG